MRVYTLVNEYDDGYESYDKTGHGDTFTSRDVAEQARQYLLDNDLGQDHGNVNDFHGDDFYCYVYEHETYDDVETWKKERIT